MTILFSHHLGISIRIIFLHFFELLFDQLSIATNFPPLVREFDASLIKKFNDGLGTCTCFGSFTVRAMVARIILFKNLLSENWKLKKKRLYDYHDNDRIWWQISKGHICPKIEIMGVHILVIICLCLKKNHQVMENIKFLDIRNLRVKMM